MILAGYGYSKHQALHLTHRDFWQIVDAHKQREARHLLDLYQVTANAFGGSKDKQEFIDGLLIRAGYKDAPKPAEIKPGEVWTKALIDTFKYMT